MLMAAHDVYGTVLAQMSNPTSEAPPVADKVMKMFRYFTWFTQMSGLAAITYGGGRFGWEKWGGGSASPKMVANAMAGGAIATSAGTIMNAIVN
ncbi:hypothetical protein ACIRRA_01240 [Nocardia sp. NPDC101769]|uniref:hypothetical protein n=1 Tax=Nocardia sp. NPDC101769 TaxID=3364333 RepID=UPI00382F262F